MAIEFRLFEPQSRLRFFCYSPLKVELQSQLNSPVTVFVDHLSKTIDCGLVERKALSGIAHSVRRLAGTIVYAGRRTSIAHGIQGQAAKVSEVRVGESLVEDVENARSELQLPGVLDDEVLSSISWHNV